MITISDIFHKFGNTYRVLFKERIPKRHIRVMWDIVNCRTASMGGHVYRCKKCKESHYTYHSCKNRHCPTCGYDTTQKWLEKQTKLLLPVNYFLLTFTIPKELRNLTRSNQKVMYNILFRTSAKSLLKLAKDPKYVGGLIGMVSVLHTWGANLIFHPHIHMIVPGGGLTVDNKWVSSGEKFLVYVENLSLIFKAKFRDELEKADLLNEVDPIVWKKSWVVHSKAVGTGHHALKYLAKYVYKVALSNNRIIKVEKDSITFSYKDSDTGIYKKMTLKTMEFMRRFLQHVLPKGFQKVRYYGLMGHRKKKLFYKVQNLLTTNTDLDCVLKEYMTDKNTDETENKVSGIQKCPKCGGELLLICRLERPPKRGPPYD